MQWHVAEIPPDVDDSGATAAVVCMVTQLKVDWYIYWTSLMSLQCFRVELDVFYLWCTTLVTRSL